MLKLRCRHHCVVVPLNISGNAMFMFELWVLPVQDVQIMHFLFNEYCH